MLNYIKAFYYNKVLFASLILLVFCLIFELSNVGIILFIAVCHKCNYGYDTVESYKLTMDAYKRFGKIPNYKYGNYCNTAGHKWAIKEIKSNIF